MVFSLDLPKRWCLGAEDLAVVMVGSGVASLLISSISLFFATSSIFGSDGTGMVAFLPVGRS